MPPLGKIARMYLLSLPSYLNGNTAWVLLGVGALISWQYYRAQKMELALFGRVRHALPQRVLISVGLGLIGGLVGSLLLTGVGVAISTQWVSYVMYGSLALALVDMRLICFAYSGGLLAISHLLFGWPQIDVASLLGLVAVLHIVESVLMLLSGPRLASPVYVRREDGHVVGGYTLQVFWPLPMLALVFIPHAIGGNGAGIPMPDWWPLIRPLGAPLSGDFTLYMIPLLAALGYGDLAVTASPRAKVRQSAARLVLFSLILLGLAWLGNRQPGWLWAAAIFSPFGHELLIVLGNRQEQTGRALWQHRGPGVMVMEVLPDGWAKRVGLRPRDVILAVNDQPLSSGAAWQEQLDLNHAAQQAESAGVGLRLTVLRASGRRSIVQLPPGPLSEPGLLLVPDSSAHSYVESRLRSPLLWLWRQWQQRRLSGE
ncbi:MAG: PDZ domain-containing protein [Bacillota bacterium]|jgi:hypothetical protein